MQVRGRGMEETAVPDQVMEGREEGLWTERNLLV